MATLPRVPHKLRFDGYELDVRAGELRKHGVRLRLRGQPLHVLEILLERAGDVVTRDELQTRIWPADTFVDFDHSLHNAIARIREVLGDSSETPRYIETLPRCGYRYIGPVEDLAGLPPAVETGEGWAQPPLSAARAERKKSLLLVGCVVACALFALGLVVWTMQQSLHAKAAAPRIRSIAVLPLANLSGDPSEEFFVDGMTDQLITDLARVGSLRVVSRTSVMQYKGARKALPEIARELKVDAIVEGSVVRSGQRVRVTAQLVRAATDQHIWAQTYDRDLGDILNLQGEVAETIAQQVRAQLTPGQEAQIRNAHAVNPEAYDAYLKGHFYFTNEFTNPDSLRKAQHYFEESVQEDPKFAVAYAGLADTYVYLAFTGALQKDEAYRYAKDALAKAMALDDSVGEEHDTLGTLSWDFDWDQAAADREFNRAIALAPSYSCAHEDRAIFLAATGRRSEALAEIGMINQLDYSFSAAHAESWTYYELQDYAGLMEASKRGLLLAPNDWFLHYSLGVGYEGTGKVQEAIPEYQTAFRISANTQSAVALAHAYSAVGKKAEAETILHDLQRRVEGTSASPYTMATIYAGLGKNDKAFELLEKAYSEKSLEIHSSLKSDLALDGLHPDPRFQSLLRRVGLDN